ncbi:MAG: O-succinylbenzoic acid--CoA ligase, partial [Bacteroidia bacterium]|nr:O-succinylbenzoic acid--CoA ligase [Bacteroidia bacterium]
FHKFTFVSLVPLQLYEIFKNQESINKLNRFKNILIGGAEIDKQLELKVRQLHVTAWHTYGMTETYSHIALRKLNGSETTDYFTPMEGVIIKRDERGCLMIKAPVTNNEFIITNDLAEINNDGNFKITGRFDFVINSGGHKLQTEQLEKSIRELVLPFHNLQFILTSVKDEKFGEKLVLLVGSSPVKLLQNDWKEYTLKEGSYSIPKEIIFVEKIPFTETGKPDRIKAKEIVSLHH